MDMALFDWLVLRLKSFSTKVLELLDWNNFMPFKKGLLEQNASVHSSGMKTCHTANKMPRH